MRSLAAVAWNKNAVDQWRWAWVISLFGLLYSLYLTSIAFFELQAACPYCLTSLGLMATIFIITTLQRPKSLAKFSWGPWLAKSRRCRRRCDPRAPSSLCRLLGRHSGPGRSVGPRSCRASVEERRQILRRFLVSALCSAKRTVWCFGQTNSLCRMQPRRSASAFGSDLQGKEYQTYPTWIINGQRYTGVQPLDTLAQLTKFKYQGGKP